MNDMGPFWDAICLLDKAVVNKKTSEMYRPAQRFLEAAGKVDGPNCLSAMSHSDANEAWSGMHEEWREINDLLSALPARKEEANHD